MNKDPNNLSFFNFFAKDWRFKDKSWDKNIFFSKLRESYLKTEKAMMQVLDGYAIPLKQRNKIIFLNKIIFEALSPSNFPFTNPQVLNQIEEENGENLIRGMKNFIHDICKNPHFFPPLADDEAFKIGENIAPTKGEVVFKNDVFELIQYEPDSTTENLKNEPLLLVPAWINKYYIFDLNKEKSFVDFNLKKGRRVFILSWVNPTREERHLTMENYLDDGIGVAVEKVYEINKRILEEKSRFNPSFNVNVAGICVGGTFALTKLAQERFKGSNFHINSLSLFMSPFDYRYLKWSELYFDENLLASLRLQLETTPIEDEQYGIIPGEVMMGIFCSLRASDLIWPNYVDRYLLGRNLPLNDILYWNQDSPRISIRVLTEYLEKFFINNSFISDFYDCNDESLKEWGNILQRGIEMVDIPCFILGAERDHLVPWVSPFSTILKIRNCKFVLCGAGHISGLLNHVESEKYHYRESDFYPFLQQNYDEGDINFISTMWLNNSIRYDGSWWIPWNKWLNENESLIYDGSV